MADGEKIALFLPSTMAADRDISGVTKLARKYNLKVIEDAAHLCPAFYGTTIQRSGVQSVGSMADISCYSFMPTMHYYGEGGMACTQNDYLAERMRIMSCTVSPKSLEALYFRGSWYYEMSPRFQYNLTDVAASIAFISCAARMRCTAATQGRPLYPALGEVRSNSAQQRPIDTLWHLYVIRLKLDR